VRCLVRPSSDTSRLRELDIETAVGNLTDAQSLARAAQGCRSVFHCGAIVSDWATVQEITQTNVAGTRNLLQAAVDASIERFIHFSTTDIYGHPGVAGIDETHTPIRFRNWYAETKLDAEAEVRRTAGAHALDEVILRPSTVYGAGSTEVVGEIARAIRNRSMVLIGRGRAIAGLCYVENLIDAAILALHHDAAPGHAFNVSDGLAVTWKEFTAGLAVGLGCRPPRWSMPYWIANGVGFSLEQGYRALRKTTRLTMPPLLSRQAVQVLGIDQDFSNRKAREMLGWDPRVGYAAGLAATLAWLQGDASSSSAHPGRLPQVSLGSRMDASRTRAGNGLEALAESRPGLRSPRR
jgi:nucleoside-diphosphate-sugar epimerase